MIIEASDGRPDRYRRLVKKGMKARFLEQGPLSRGEGKILTEARNVALKCESAVASMESGPVINASPKTHLTSW